MARKVRDFVRIDAGGLDDLIAALTAVRDGLPEGAEPEVKLRGCDVWGRHIAVAFMRPQTAEEVETDARYAEAARLMIERQEREKAEKGHNGHLLAA